MILVPGRTRLESVSCYKQAKMSFHTIAEIFGHLLFGFTRSVAERYNFDEVENPSDLLGYNALEDTGKEWYCQPVGEVIYQEYSNSEATAIDYLATRSNNVRITDACSIEDDEETQEESKERVMAWKHLRPSIFRTLWSSLYFGFFISVLSAAIVGFMSFPVYYFSYQTELNCEMPHPKESIPIRLQWVITSSEIFSVGFLYYWLLLNLLFYYRPFQISGLKLRMVLLAVPFYLLDSGYRVAMQAFGISHSKLTSLQRLPCVMIFNLSNCAQIYILKKHFCPTGTIIKQVKFILLFVAPYVLTEITGVLIAFSIFPAYNKQGKTGKVIIAIFTPLIMVFHKGVSRLCIQKFWCRMSHPGTSFVLLAPLYCGSAVLLRLLQVDLHSLESVALIGVIHGIAEVVERSTTVFLDHICHQVLEKRRLPWGGFRTPRRERLAADISLMSMLYEPSAVISVNIFLHLYRYFNTRMNSPVELLQSFAITTSVPLVIEWLFTSVSIAIETRYQNMPLMAVWRKRWRRYIAVAVVNTVMVSIWTSSSLLIAVQGRFQDDTKDHCEMPFSSGL